jgi:hypothetical protein
MIGLRFDNNEIYPLCNNVKFDNTTIFEDQNLYEHFRDNSNNPESIPPAVKDKNELRERLEQRGLNRETIDQYLSFSTLEDPSS